MLGELAKYDMLHEAIVHRCIKQVIVIIFYFHISILCCDLAGPLKILDNPHAL